MKRRQHQQPKVWLADYCLTQFDKDALLCPAGWITDTLIDASQKLLKQQFPNLPGLENVDLGLFMNFAVQPGHFLQILNTSHRHWLTISTIGVQHPEIHVFDSLYNSIPRMAQAQIATIMCTQENTIEVKIIDVQQQVSIQASHKLLHEAITHASMMTVLYLLTCRMGLQTVVCMQLHLLRQLRLGMIQLLVYLMPKK